MKPCSPQAILDAVRGCLPEAPTGEPPDEEPPAGDVPASDPPVTEPA